MNLQGNSDSDKVRFKCLNMTVSTLKGKTGMLVPLEGIVQTLELENLNYMNLVVNVK